MSGLAIASGQPTNVPVVIDQNGVPIGISPTGSMAANGAVTIGTALDQIYADGIWLYYPVGAAYGGSVAGFFLTVIFSTTPGTVFNNNY